MQYVQLSCSVVKSATYSKRPETPNHAASQEVLSMFGSRMDEMLDVSEFEHCRIVVSRWCFQQLRNSCTPLSDFSKITGRTQAGK